MRSTKTITVNYSNQSDSTFAGLRVPAGMRFESASARASTMHLTLLRPCLPLTSSPRARDAHRLLLIWIAICTRRNHSGSRKLPEALEIFLFTYETSSSKQDNLQIIFTSFFIFRSSFGWIFKQTVVFNRNNFLRFQLVETKLGHSIENDWSSISKKLDTTQLKDSESR